MSGMLVWWLVVMALAWEYSGAIPATSPSCQPDKLTVYKVVMHTFWTRDKFPKHYPDWRPPAQWSKLFGRSHDTSFALWRVGRRASAGVKEFAETGRSDLLEAQTQGDGGVYDEFSAPPVTAGAGRTEAEFFVDGNHSRVSLMSRIVPSPDWFIGLESFDLCVNGNWLDSITIEVEPMDAGTDNGFTFTAPNWPTDPQGVVYRITSRYPAHPAGSFYYPHLVRLPPIATFQFIKVKEYELSEVFHHTEDDRRYEVLKMEHLQAQNDINLLNGDNNDIERQIEEEREEQEKHPLHPPSPLPKFLLDMPVISSTSASTDFNNSTIANSSLQTDKSINSLRNQYRTNMNKERRKKYRLGKSRVRKIRPPRDCRVSEWSEWGACSKSCGIGEMERRRTVTKHARRGGRSCPPLLETKWCGSERGCPKDYFNW